MTPRPLSMLLAPGAGAPSSSPWMQRYRQLLAELGRVETLDYPYMLAGRRAPDPLPRLVAAHEAAIDALRARSPDARLVLVGKSMGGRVGVHAAQRKDVHAVVCLGYPLKGAGARAKLRDDILYSLRTPILFVQGTRDPLCPLDLLESVRAKMKAEHELFVVQGGNHSLEVDRRTLAASARTQADVEQQVLDRIRMFLQAR